MAFLRAVNEPPMQPLFPSYTHICTDELLGSWLFIFASIPYIPYSIIYVINDPEKVLYYCMLATAVFALFGAWLFLINCYPSEKVCSACVHVCAVKVFVVFVVLALTIGIARLDKRYIHITLPQLHQLWQLLL